MVVDASKQPFPGGGVGERGLWVRVVGLASEEPLDGDRALAQVVIVLLEGVKLPAPVELRGDLAPEGLGMLDAAGVHFVVLLQALAVRILGELRGRLVKLDLCVGVLREHPAPRSPNPPKIPDVPGAKAHVKEALPKVV